MYILLALVLVFIHKKELYCVNIGRQTIFEVFFVDVTSAFFITLQLFMCYGVNTKIRVKKKHTKVFTSWCIRSLTCWGRVTEHLYIQILAPYPYTHVCMHWLLCKWKERDRKMFSFIEPHRMRMALGFFCFARSFISNIQHRRREGRATNISQSAGIGTITSGTINDWVIHDR